MSIFSIFKRKSPTIQQQMEDWTDEECLINFMSFFPRVGIGTELIQNDVGFVTAEVLHIQCGDSVITSPPLPMDWPLEPVAFPEECKETLN